MSGTHARPPIQARYLTTPDAAVHLGLKPRTLEKHRYCGTGPPYHKLGGKVVYTIEALDAWAKLGLRRSTFEKALGICRTPRRVPRPVKR